MTKIRPAISINPPDPPIHDPTPYRPRHGQPRREPQSGGGGPLHRGAPLSLDQYVPSPLTARMQRLGIAPFYANRMVDQARRGYLSQQGGELAVNDPRLQYESGEPQGLHRLAYGNRGNQYADQHAKLMQGLLAMAQRRRAPAGQLGPALTGPPAMSPDLMHVVRLLQRGR